MTKDRQVLFNVNTELYEEFKHYCEQGGSNASRKLREFVIAYVRTCRDNEIKEALQDRK